MLLLVIPASDWTSFGRKPDKREARRSSDGPKGERSELSILTLPPYLPEEQQQQQHGSQLSLG